MNLNVYCCVSNHWEVFKFADALEWNVTDSGRLQIIRQNGQGLSSCKQCVAEFNHGTASLGLLRRRRTQTYVCPTRRCG
jgi:hypothetical protein